MLMLLSLLSSRALAGGIGIGQGSNDKDYLGNRNVPPNIIFVIDVHNDTTTQKCFALADATGPCIDQIENALQEVLPRENWARYGIVYTRSSVLSVDNFTTPTTNYTGAFYGLEADGVGTTQSLYNAIDFLSTIPTDTVNFPQPNTVRNPSEAIRRLYIDVLRSATIGDGWNVSPILHSCQDTHIILITTARPTNGDNMSGTLTTMGGGSIRDVCCDDLGNYTSGSSTASCLSGGGAPASDSECHLDNVARELWLGDASLAIAGVQKVRLHTIYLDDSSESALDRTIANALYSNVQTVQSNTFNPPFATSYIHLDETVAGTNSYDIAPAIRDTLWFIRDRVVAEDNSSGAEDTLQGKVDTRGKYAAFAYSQLVGDSSTSHGEARDSGHIVVYELQSDPTIAGYGGLIIPPWILDIATNEAAREETTLFPPTNSDFPRASPSDMQRNVYTYLSSAENMLTGAQFTIWKNKARMPFDDNLAQAIASDGSGQKANWLAGILGPTGGADPDQLDADFDGDMDVDANDFSNVVAFAHDWDSAVYRWGYKGAAAQRDTFGDDRMPGFSGAIPAVVDYDSTTEITSETSYETYLSLLSSQAYGVFTFIGANDGSLRAYVITDPGAWWGGGGFYGYEVFRWIPEGVLARDPTLLNNLFPSFSWHGSYVDQLIYGRRLLGGGSVTVRDVWIDSQNTSGQAGFGTKECTTLTNCEWRRIAVLAREDDGAGVLVLDITNPYSPTFMREYYPQDGDGTGTSRPVVARVFDDSDASPAEHVDRTVLFFGSGRPVDIRDAAGDGTRHGIEPGIRTFDVTQTKPVDRTTYTAISNVSSPLPDWSGSSPDENTYDGDSAMEFGGTESPLAVLDTDADGDADTAYFTLTKTFREGFDAGGAGEGSAPWNSQQLPSTSLYKACRETAGQPGTWTYLKLADLGVTEVYYAPTLSYFSDGAVGIYLVTSTPYELDELDYTALADTSTTNQRVYFGYDTNPDGCSVSAFTFTRKDTITGGTSCTSNQYLNLLPGERVVADPVIFGGYLLLSTYYQTPGVLAGAPSPACTIAGTSGRIRAYNYESCVLVNPTSAFVGGQVLIPGYPSNMAISDFGTIMAMGNNAALTKAYSFNVNVGLFESVKVLNWMQVF
jgi:hypothetical protein